MPSGFDAIKPEKKRNNRIRCKILDIDFITVFFGNQYVNYPVFTKLNPKRLQSPVNQYLSIGWYCKKQQMRQLGLCGVVYICKMAAS